MSILVMGIIIIITIGNGMISNDATNDIAQSTLRVTVNNDTIWRFLTGSEQPETVCDRPRSGRSRVTNPVQDCCIHHVHLNHIPLRTHELETHP